MRKIKYLTFKWLMLTCLLVVLFNSCEKYDNYTCNADLFSQTTNLVTPGKAEQIANEVCETMNSNKLIGVQLSIRDSLNESWNVSFGATDLKQKNKLTNDHILRIGSVTKIFTSALILKLIESDYLDLEQKLSHFYPENDNIEGITIKNLLNHSSGIVDVFANPSIFISSSNFPNKQWNPNQLAENCMDKNLEFSPGSKHSYSNTNYIILGLVAEKATGKKITELFSEYIIKPNNLTNTYLVPYMDTPSNLVNGYVHHFALSLKEWYTNKPENTSWSTVGFTAGAMVSNSMDLSAFTYSLFNGNIINNESLKQMTTFSGDKGLGLFKTYVNDSYYWGHEGEITGFESITFYNPETKIVISVCCNTTPYNIFDLLKKIDEIL